MLLQQKTVIGPDGRVEAVPDEKTAKQLAGSWLAFAMGEITRPEGAEELTRLCPYPHCTLFIDHEGDHKLTADPPAQKAVSDQPEPQPQKEPKKRGRKPRPTAEPGAPA